MDLSALAREFQFAAQFYRRHLRVLLLTVSLAFLPVAGVRAGMGLYLEAGRSEMTSDLHDLRQRTAERRGASGEVKRALQARSHRAARAGIRKATAEVRGEGRRAQSLMANAWAQFWGSLLVALVLVPLSVVAAVFGQSAVLEHLRAWRGHQGGLSVKEAWVAALGRAPALGASAVVTAGLVLAGGCALILPGLFALYCGALVVPVTVLEGLSGWGAFRRSATLMLRSGHESGGTWLLCVAVEWGGRTAAEVLLPEALEPFGLLLVGVLTLPLTAVLLFRAYEAMATAQKRGGAP